MHTNINIIKIYSNNIFYDNINIDNILLTYTMIIFGINNTINIQVNIIINKLIL